MLDDLAELGVDMLWAQLNVNDNEVLAEKCKAHNICLMPHLERQRLMPFGMREEIDCTVSEVAATFMEPKKSSSIR